MQIFSFSHFISSNKRAIVTTAISSFAVGLIAMLVLMFGVTRNYTSTVQILVIQKYTLTDSYTAAKSAEKVSQNLGEVIKTSVFLNDVLDESTVSLSDITQLPEEQKRKAWAKKLSTEIDNNAPILKITAYDPERSRAEAIATTVANVLIEKGGEYHGAPDTISLKVVDTALTSNSASSPSVPLYTVAAVLGTACIFTLFYALKATGSWLEPISVVPSTLVHVNQPELPLQSRPEPTMPTPQPQPRDLNIQNFGQRIAEQRKDSAYIHGDVKTMYDVKKS
ncbi:MAG: hypothetical protein KIH62_005235 [Candidatus Kerfeldbacteria bacterium]|nr:hypothetical protein [Candidatus Kerfeldbacteria bacterium]